MNPGCRTEASVVGWGTDEVAAMTNDEIRSFVGCHTKAWNDRDPVALSSNHTESGIVVSPMFRRVEGRSEIRRTYSELFSAFPDWDIHYDEPIVEGSRLVLFFSVLATHQGEFMGVAGSHRRCSFDGVSLFRLTPDLLIAEERRVYDFTHLLIQLGVLRVRVAR